MHMRLYPKPVLAVALVCSDDYLSELSLVS